MKKPILVNPEEERVLKSSLLVIIKSQNLYIDDLSFFSNGSDEESLQIQKKKDTNRDAKLKTRHDAISKTNQN